MTAHCRGVGLEIHRNTWRYNKLIEIQRRIVLEQRGRVLRTDAALRAPARRCPDRYAALGAVASDEVLVDAARQITLRHLDLSRARQPVRHGHRPGTAQRGPRNAPAAANLIAVARKGEAPGRGRAAATRPLSRFLLEQTGGLVVAGAWWHDVGMATAGRA